MKNYISSFFSIFLFGLVYPFVGIAGHDHNHSPRIAFIENKGQWEQPVLFRADLPDYSVFLEEDGFTYMFGHPEDLANMHDIINLPEEERNQHFIRAHAVKIKFLGSQEANISGEEKTSFYYNYFLGNNPDRWASHVNLFRHVAYSEIYPGISLQANLAQNNFKYDIILDPGADVSQMKFLYEGQDLLQLKDGKLVITTSTGEIIENIPLAYQPNGLSNKEIECKYVLEGNTISFEFPQGIDTSLPVVIDPVVVAATLSGTTGFASNWGHGAAYDLEGNIFTHAISFDSGYPTTTGAFQISYGGGSTDVAISKFNPTGTDLLYATFLGGSGSDYPHSTITNLEGDLFIYGSTDSQDYPVGDNAFQSESGGGIDIFISRLSSNGEELLGGTYLGGSQNDGRSIVSVNYGDSYRGEIFLEQNHVYITSCTQSEDFPATGLAFQQDFGGGSQDGIVAKLNQNLTSSAWISFVGGSGDDMMYGIRVVPGGGIYCSGSSTSDDFPIGENAYQNTNQGNRDCVVIKISEDGTTLLNSTYLGTELEDQAFFLDIDNNDNPWIYGQTKGDWQVSDSLVYINPGGNLFITKLNPNLSGILKSTTIGPPSDWSYSGVPVAFLVDRCGRVYMSAYSAVGGFEVTNDALFTTGGFYLAAFSEELEVFEYGTYYTENHVDGGTSRFDKKGVVYQGVCSGGGFSTNADAFAPTQSPSYDIGVFKIDFELEGVNAAITAPDELNGCAPHTVQFQNYSVGEIFVWDFGDGSPVSNEENPEHTYTEPGVYTVMMISSDELSCNLADTAYLDISVSIPQDFTPSFSYEINCEEGTVVVNNLTGIDYLEYHWDMGDGTTYVAEEVEHSYNTGGTYDITLTAIDNGCDANEEVTQTIFFSTEVIAAFTGPSVISCPPYEAVFDNQSIGASFSWNFGDGSTSNEEEPVHVYTQPGEYQVILTVNGSENCPGGGEAEITIVVEEAPELEAFITYEQFGECSQMIFKAENHSLGNYNSQNWYFDGQYIGNEDQLEYAAITPGNHTLELVISEPQCQLKDSLSIPVNLIYSLDINLPPAINICYDKNSVMLDAKVNHPDASFLWLPGGEETSSIEAFHEGIYTVTVDAGCSDSKEVIVGMGEQQFSGYETEICEGTDNEITIHRMAESYLWETGHTSKSIKITRAGLYPYTYVDLRGCTQADTILVTAKESESYMYVPNAFTPNGDGINDIFRPVGSRVEIFELKIFNRWGEMINSAYDAADGWNGTIKENGYLLPSGVYPYMFKYKGECEVEPKVYRGNINLIR